MNSRSSFGVFLVLCACGALAQQSAAAPAPIGASSTVPSLISYTGVLKAASGRTLASVTGVTFLLYKDQEGGSPLWLETQNVTPDKAGRYTVQLGAASAKGLPSDLFVTGEARWLAVQVGNETEQARVLLVAVPYAMKAADAQTLGGLPASAFVLAAPPSSITPVPASSGTTAASVLPPATSNVTTTGGTVNALPLWTTATNIQTSAVSQTGTGATAKIGINTPTPAVTLDVRGNANVGGLLTLPATGLANASVGKNSQAQDFIASSFNSSMGKAVTQIFQLRAEPSGNNTAGASGTLNLLFGAGAVSPAETGLRIASNGRITFAPGQTFPGTGTGTVKSVGLTAPATDFTVSGSPVTGTGTLGLAWKVAPTSANTANALVKRDGTGSFNVTSVNGSGTFSTTTANANGVLVNASAPNAVAVQANATALSGNTIGIIGATVSPDTNSTGVWGQANNTGASFTEGVVGTSGSKGGIGVLGFTGGSTTNEANGQLGVSLQTGVWGDGRGQGIMGTSDNGHAITGFNNSQGAPTLLIQNDVTGSGNLFFALSGSTFANCSIDTSANLSCSGTISAPVPVGPRQVALYAMQSPENWFEDFGTAHLANGLAMVQLDPTFAQTVNMQNEYHVFLTPNGDSKGLYVARKTPTAFEVREQGGGTSSISFDYRIVAKRLGYETTRMPDMRPMLDKLRSQMPVRRANATKGVAAIK